MAFFKLSKSFLPYYTPNKILLKSSSQMIISAQSLAIYEPDPIQIPAFDILRAEESFTPSPVTVTICPIFCNASTINIL